MDKRNTGVGGYTVLSRIFWKSAESHTHSIVTSSPTRRVLGNDASLSYGRDSLGRVQGLARSGR